MKKIFNLNNNFRILYLFIIIIMITRPAYSIPTSIEELKKSIGSICTDYNFDFCAVEEKEVKKKKKPRKFTETEQKILTRLAEQEQLLSSRSLDLDRRENKLKSLQEEIQRQVAQLEKLQKEIESEIEKKKNQDESQLEKAVALYSKMDATTAAQSIAKLDRGIAVNILKQMKEKQASLVLASMGASESANLIAEMTAK
tara:strand:+ start:417 stop:1013 length:597 start_codon:yes stop_codon:yes gene_type:complete